MTGDALLQVLFIFVLRIFNNAIGTFRLVLIARGQRNAAAILGFIEAATFAYTIANVVTDLTNWPNFLAYCGGFSVGSWVGMWMEARFVRSFATVNIIARQRGHEIAAALRANGFGVTLTSGEGRDGEVKVLRSVISSRDVPRLMQTAREVQEDVFVAVEPAMNVSRGWLGGRSQL